jgi:hypothetical protein
LNLSCLTDCYGNSPTCVSSAIYSKNTISSYTLQEKV